MGNTGMSRRKGENIMPRKANYPEWVTKHLEKGIYVNRVGDKYYLYRAHSERKPGNRNPVRVFDGYVGTVTEKDGLGKLLFCLTPETINDAMKAAKKIRKKKAAAQEA